MTVIFGVTYQRHLSSAGSAGDGNEGGILLVAVAVVVVEVIAFSYFPLIDPYL